MRKERIPDDEFIANVQAGLSKLIGNFVKVTVRQGSRKDLKTVEGKLISVDRDRFKMEMTFNDNKLAEFNLLDVHFYSSPFSKDYTGIWPLRYRR